MSERFRRSVVWLRRDLRLRDNTALFEACRNSNAVCLTFVLSPELLRSERTGAPIVSVFFDALAELRRDLRERGSDLVLLQGEFEQELSMLVSKCGAQAVFYNEDYEPEAIQRDERVSKALERCGIAVRKYRDHVYFGAEEITANDGAPYRVFTPYRKRWLERRAVAPRAPIPSESAIAGKLLAAAQLLKTPHGPVLEQFGYTASAAYPRASEKEAQHRLEEFLDTGAVERYAVDRNVPALSGTSRLSPQLRAGTIGIRTCVEAAFLHKARAPQAAHTGIDTWVAELVWREFYQMILRRFPHVAQQPFLAAARDIEWRDDPQGFALWCSGQTGYPIVDAGMHQLNETGWMHNRLRMIAASFLSKHLLIDPRRGERYFEQHLADADLAQNNGGWQWAASTGVDPMPYFRMFNPTLQSKRFDPQGHFIKMMLPQLSAVPVQYIHEPWRMAGNHARPIVAHEFARARALAVYGRALRTTSRAQRS